MLLAAVNGGFRAYEVQNVFAAGQRKVNALLLLLWLLLLFSPCINTLSALVFASIENPCTWIDLYLAPNGEIDKHPSEECNLWKLRVNI